MQVSLKIRLEGGWPEFGDDAREAKTKLADQLVQVAERLRASNQDQFRVTLADDETGAVLGELMVMIRDQPGPMARHLAELSF